MQKPVSGVDLGPEEVGVAGDYAEAVSKRLVKEDCDANRRRWLDPVEDAKKGVGSDGEGEG